MTSSRWFKQQVLLTVYKTLLWRNCCSYQRNLVTKQKLTHTIKLTCFCKPVLQSLQDKGCFKHLITVTVPVRRSASALMHLLIIGSRLQYSLNVQADLAAGQLNAGPRCCCSPSASTWWSSVSLWPRKQLLIEDKDKKGSFWCRSCNKAPPHSSRSVSCCARCLRLWGLPDRGRRSPAGYQKIGFLPL